MKFQTKTPIQHTLAALALQALSLAWLPLTASAQLVPSADQNSVLTRRPRVEVSSLSALMNLPLSDQGATVTYYDGLGRPAQAVEVAHTPEGKDLVQGVYYDELGRPSRSYLPYEAPAGTGSYRPGWEAETASSPLYAGEGGRVFGQTTYDGSPLNRVVAEQGPGRAWHDAERQITYTHGTNGADQVKVWVALGETLYQIGYYPSGRLHLLEQTDEDGRTTREWKDMLNRLVLKESQVDEDTWAQTYYVYDVIGMLRYVLPPEASSQITTTELPPTSPLVQQYCYYYRYDGRKRLVEKQLPGAEPVYLVYDGRDRLVLTQDGNLRVGQSGYPPHSWQFTKYDQLNRPVLTGVYQPTGAPNRAALQARVDLFYASASVGENPTRAYGEEDGDAVLGYTNRSFPAVPDEAAYLTATYYDRYPATVSGLGYSARELAGEEMPSASERTRGEKTAQTIRVLSMETGATPRWLSTKYYYDQRGRLLQEVAQAAIGSTPGEVRTSYRYAFRGEVLADQVELSWFPLLGASPLEPITLTHRHSYDGAGRHLATEERVNGGPWTVTTESEHNALSQLTRKRLAEGAQSVDYRYNVRGWLTRINDVRRIGDDLFAMDLRYHTGATPQYGGNIGELRWRTVPHGNDLLGETHTYAMTYDMLGRLSQASYLTKFGSGAFDEQMAYDLNGNLTNLSRNVQGEKAPELLDNLLYSYQGNQVKRISNTSGSTHPEAYPTASAAFMSLFGYDANGNMTNEPNRSLAVDYSVLNLPCEVRSAFGKERVRYTYDAQGGKRETRVTTNTHSVHSFYVGPAVYESDGKEFALRYLITGYGRLVKEKDRFEPEYHLTDHLGNVRVAFSVGVSGQPSLRQVNAYYPFGKQIGSLAFLRGTDNRLKYNGKEEQEFSINGQELGWYDYHARFYDAALGRFTTMDPHAENYLSWTPYNYVGNNPIVLTDPTGMDWYEDKDGNTMWQEGSDDVEGYTNIGANYSYRQGDVTYSYEQNEIVSLEEHVLDKSEWKTSQVKDANGKKKQCFTAAKEMVTESGATMLGGTPNGILTGTEVKTKDGYKVNATGDVGKGVDYINSQVDAGKSVGIGVDYAFGKGINEGTTDHWVAISSRVTNLRTNSTSFKFYDTGTSWVDKGTHSSNVFSVKNGVLVGKTFYSGKTYTVSQVRKNKP